MSIVFDQPCSLGAGWIFTMLGSPLEYHWINVSENKVESVSKKPAYTLISYLGEHTAILPAAVNVHTHLELSQLETPLDVSSRSMPDWVSALLAFRRSADYSAQKGIAQAMQRPEFIESTIACADIVPPTLAITDIKTENGTLPVQWFPFTELIAWRSEWVNDKMCDVPDIFGFSPHAPQTVCPELLQKAVRQNKPIAMHLAETQEELQLLREFSGPLVDMMRRADPDYDPKSVVLGMRPIEYLELLSEAQSVLIIHGNYLDDKELRFLAAHRETMSVVYCPRSHAYFGHSAYPLKKMLDMGVNVLLGTDSLASVPDLSLANEMEFVLDHHRNLRPQDVYRLGTQAGAMALHLPKEFGTIQPGSPARFTVLLPQRLDSVL